MEIEDQLQQHIIKHLARAGCDSELPAFTESEAIDFLFCVIQPDDSPYNFIDDRETAQFFKAMIDLLRVRKHVGIAFHRHHMSN